MPHARVAPAWAPANVQGVDAEWMRERLVAYLEVCGAIRREQSSHDEYWTDECSRLNDQAILQISTIEKIVRRLDPNFSGPLMPPSYSSFDHVRVVRQALGALEDHDEVARALTPESPSLDAVGFHPLIWRAASVIWDTGEFKTAVQQAAVALSAHIKKRALSTLNDGKLVQQVFASDPPRPGQPRLHVPGDRNDESWQSRQRGLHHLAQGAFAGIRNIAAHEDVLWSEAEALEHLAVLSVVARWADMTELVTVE